jgi:hypothetical protein
MDPKPVAMRTILLLGLSLATSACSTPGVYPSLAPRPAEGIDPRVPVSATPSDGTVDPRTAAALAVAVGAARGAVAEFDRLARTAEALTAAAGPRQSEGWIAAQQALSALGAQHGVTTDAAARIDAVAADGIDQTRWLVPATQAAIGAAAAEVGAINDRQRATIDRLGVRLGS